MLFNVTFIGVFLALYGGVNSSPYRIYDVTYNRTNPPSRIPSLYPTNGLNFTDAELTSHTFRDLVLAVQLDELRNASAQPHLNGKSRRKRSIFNLISMLGCATDCTRIYLIWYGNYCGWGGSGQPIDDIDRCCQWHDACYSRVMNNYDLWSFSMYFRSYDWSCTRGRSTCGRYQDEWRRQACLCDLRFTECLNKYGCPYW